MKCSQVSDLISPFVDGALSPDKAEAVRAHAAECVLCRTELAAERASVKALEAPRMIFDAPDILAAIRNQVAQPKSQRSRFRWQWAFAGVAAACALAWLSVALTHEDVAPTRTAVTPPVESVQPHASNPAQEVATDNCDKLPSKPTIIVHKSYMPPHQHRKHTVAQAPKPRKITRPEKAPSTAGQPAPEIEYLVVYNHAGLGGGMTPDETAEAAAGDAEPPAPSAYSISVTDESTGEVTNVSAYSSSDEESGERASVTFRGNASGTDRDERERSSTDETPLDCAGGSDRHDMC